MRRAMFMAILEKLFKAIDEARFAEETEALYKLFKDTKAFETFNAAYAVAAQWFVDSICLID